MNYNYVIGEMTLIKYLEIYEDTIHFSPYHMFEMLYDNVRRRGGGVRPKAYMR